MRVYIVGKGVICVNPYAITCVYKADGKYQMVLNVEEREEIDHDSYDRIVAWMERQEPVEKPDLSKVTPETIRVLEDALGPLPDGFRRRMEGLDG